MNRRGILGYLFGTRLSWNQVGDAPALGPSRIWLNAGPAPADTTRQTASGPETWDAVLYLDSTDSKLKMLQSDGIIIVID